MVVMVLLMSGCAGSDKIPLQFLFFDKALSDRELCEKTLLAAQHDWGDKELLLTTAFYIPTHKSVNLEEHFFGVREDEKFTGGKRDLDRFKTEPVGLNSGGPSTALFRSNETQVFRSMTGPSWYDTSVQQACIHVGDGIGLSGVRFDSEIR